MAAPVVRKGVRSELQQKVEKGTESLRQAGRYSSGLWLGLVLGFLFAFPVVVAALYVYIRYGHPPVAVADAPFPEEAQIVHIPLNARIARELKTSPIEATPEDLLGGAHVYASQCAFCHGAPGNPSGIGANQYPTAPQLWQKHGHEDVVGVSDDPAGETYWKVANGIRLTGMPAFQRTLSEPEMWQVSLLLAQADKPQRPEVLSVLGSTVADFAHPEQDKNKAPESK